MAGNGPALNRVRSRQAQALSQILHSSGIHFASMLVTLTDLEARLDNCCFSLYWAASASLVTDWPPKQKAYPHSCMMDVFKSQGSWQYDKGFM